MRDRVIKIARKIIDESFPLLKEKNILILVFWFRFFAFSVWIPPFIRVVVISTRTRASSDDVLTGILAHELCHQERYLRMNLFEYLRFAVLYTFSGSQRTYEERATDMLTIEKGYGRQLYDLTLISGKDKKHKSILYNYLSAEEIKTYAQQIEKWYI